MMSNTFVGDLMCAELPPNIHSSGLWAKPNDTSGGAGAKFGTKGSTLPMLEQKMAMIFLATQLIHLVLSCFGVPVSLLEKCPIETVLYLSLSML